MNTGPLWFVGELLIFSLGYAGFGSDVEQVESHAGLSDESGPGARLPGPAAP